MALLIRSDEKKGTGYFLFRSLIVGVESRHTVRAHSMGELGERMLLNVGFNMVPISLVIANLFAGRTDRDQPAQGLDVDQGIL